MNLQETQDLIRIMQALEKLYPKLTNYAAITAVNFFKDRLVVGRDIFNVPLKPRSKNVWVSRGRDKKGGRAIGVDTATMKRDIQKIYVSADSAIVGTTRISAPYAQVFNEGFKGTITQNVKAGTRRRWGKEKRGTGVFDVKTRRERTKTVKVQTGEIKVKAFTRRIKRDQPARQIMGNSPMLDRRIQAEITRQFIDTITKASAK